MENADIPARLVSHYQLLGLIGRGATGTVYKARDTRLNRLVALKFLAPGLLDSPEARERFESEARTIASLSHNNIGVLYDVGVDDGIPFLVLEYLGGGTLASRIRDRQIPLTEILVYARQIADGLGHAHNHGILHRDVKPGNALFAESGALKIVDFGLARRQAGDSSDGPAALCGTPAYMAPEQTRCGVVDQRSDIFAFGILLYQFAAGRLPFLADHASGVFRQICEADPPSLASIRPDLPAAFISLVNRCLCKDPEGRPRSMAAIRHELDLLEGSATPAHVLSPDSPTVTALLTRTGPLTRIGRTARRWLIGMAVAAVLIPLAYFVPGWIHPPVTGPGSRRCVVVLPFNCKDTEEAAVRFCRGLDVELTYLLIRTQHLQTHFWTLSPSEVAAREVHSASEAASRLRAAFVLGGTVVRAAGGYEIHLDLSEAPTARLLDSRSVQVSAAELLTLPSGFLLAALDLLDTAVPRGTLFSLAAAQTTNPQAWQLYVQAQGMVARYGGPEPAAEAISILDRAIDMDPRNAAAYALASQAWLQRYDADRDPGHIRHAVDAANAALKLDPGDYRVLLSIGQVRLREQRPQEAVTLFTRAASLNRGDPDPLRLLALAWTAAGQNDKAFDAYRLAMNVNPSFWPTWQNRARLYRDLGLHEKAIEDLQTALKLSPGNADLYRDLGIYSTELGRFEEAEKFLDQSLRLKKSPRALNAYGYLREKQNRLEEAASFYRDASAAAPKNMLLMYNLGEILNRLPDRGAEARAAWTRCVELLGEMRSVNSAGAGNLSKGAVCQGRLGDLARARRTASDAVARSPAEKMVLLDAAVVAALDKDRARTRQLLERAIRAGEKPQSVLDNPDFELVTREPGTRQRLIALEPPQQRKED